MNRRQFLKQVLSSLLMLPFVGGLLVKQKSKQQFKTIEEIALRKDRYQNLWGESPLKPDWSMESTPMGKNRYYDLWKKVEGVPEEKRIVSSYGEPQLALITFDSATVGGKSTSYYQMVRMNYVTGKYEPVEGSEKIYLKDVDWNSRPQRFGSMFDEIIWK